MFDFVMEIALKCSREGKSWWESVLGTRGDGRGRGTSKTKFPGWTPAKLFFSLAGVERMKWTARPHQKKCGPLVFNVIRILRG